VNRFIKEEQNEVEMGGNICEQNQWKMAGYADKENGMTWW
jgi:hypothetical protein